MGADFRSSEEEMEMVGQDRRHDAGHSRKERQGELKRDGEGEGHFM